VLAAKLYVADWDELTDRRVGPSCWVKAASAKNDLETEHVPLQLELKLPVEKKVLSGSIESLYTAVPGPVLAVKVGRKFKVTWV
jgi:hypothetical protein